MKDQIIISEITKIFKDTKISKGKFIHTMVSFNRDRLISTIEKKYKTSLIKDDKDDFPYFTDGGFKFSFDDENCKYEVIAFPHEIIV